MTGITPEEMKRALKEAIKEWLDEKMSEFGVISIKFILAAATGVLAYFVLTQNGWRRI